jgi:Chromosome segregation ATPases
LNVEIDKVKEVINAKKNDEAISVLDNFKIIIEAYADSYSKNQNIKKESVKRSERIKVIDKEIESWKNLLTNSEKMITELDGRKNKLKENLNQLEAEPQSQAEKKGQISEGLRISEVEKKKDEEAINEIDKKINSLREDLSSVQEKMIQIRERRASSSATIDGLKQRKNDLLERIDTELNINENNLLEFSGLKESENLPDAVEQEELLDAKKRDREKLGSVNLRADEETTKYEVEIKKMEKDRQDLVTAIIKLKKGINELNQKGRESKEEAFEKVNRKFNEVYTKLLM